MPEHAIFEKFRSQKTFRIELRISFGAGMDLRLVRKFTIAETGSRRHPKEVYIFIPGKCRST